MSKVSNILTSFPWSIRVQTMINCCRFVFNNNIDSWGGREENFLASFQTVSSPPPFPTQVHLILISPKMAARNAKRERSLLVKVLEVKKVYVIWAPLTVPTWTSYSVKVFSFLISIGATFYLFHFIFAFSLLTFFSRLYRRQLLFCCPSRIAPLIVGNIILMFDNWIKRCCWRSYKKIAGLRTIKESEKQIAPPSRHFHGLYSYRPELSTNQRARNPTVIVKFLLLFTGYCLRISYGGR